MCRARHPGVWELGIDHLKAEATDAALVPAEVVGELVAQRPLDLRSKQARIVAEVAFERVAVDHDPVLPAFPGDPVAEVLAVGVPLAAELGNDHRHRLQHAAEFLREGVDRVGDERFEGIKVGLRGHHLTVKSLASPRPAGPAKATGGIEMDDERATARTSRWRWGAAALAVVGALLAGILLPACGGGSGTSSTSQAQKEAEEGVESAERGFEEGKEKAEQGLEEAEEKLKSSKGTTKKTAEEAQEEAEKGIEEAKKQIEDTKGGTKKGLEEAKKKAEKGLEEAKKKAEELLP